MVRTAETHTAFQQAKGIFTGALLIAAIIPSAWERGNRILGQSSKKDRRRC